MTTNATNADERSEEVKYDRRRFLSTAAMSVAAAQLGMAGFADAQSNKAKSANSPLNVKK